MKLLIIDDDKIYAKALKQAVLKNTSIKNIDLIYSKEEIDKINLKEYDLIISDIFMENFNEDVIEKEIILKNIPTILITALPDRVIKEKLEKLNIIDFIIKTLYKDFTPLINKLKILEYLRNTHILIVDDSKTAILINVRAVKRKYPFAKILTASNGIEALEKIKQYDNIKLILTDYEMPKMNGLEFIQKVREKYSIDEKIIIALSSEQDKGLSPLLLRVGANDFLYKPFLEEELMCRIDNNIKNIMLIEEIKEMAYKDPLTHLYNRRYFFETAEKLFITSTRENKEISILMYDIDHFKKINDTYGHQTGDLILEKVAEIISNNTRKNDISARYGGEEFISFLYHCDATFARLVAEKIRKIIEQIEVTDSNKNSIKFTISIGVSDKGNNLEEMIKYADNALYEAKKTRNRVIVYKGDENEKK